jgi:TetR/AcrR family transcriptional repressor of nem operon
MVWHSHNFHVLRDFVVAGQQSAVLSGSMDADAIANYLQNCINGIVVSAKAGMSQSACERMVEDTLRLLNPCPDQ